MLTTTVQNWGEVVLASVASALVLLLAGIPKILAFALIVLIGWVVASALAAAVGAVLRAVRFNDLARRSGLSGFVQQMGVHTDAAGFLADIAKWFVRLIVLVSAFDALGLPAVSQVLQRLLLWLPSLAVALVVLVIGGLAATALANLMRGATAETGVGNPDLLASIARVAVWAFAILVAVDQVGIATELVNILFMGIVGALALAFGLAFGLGGRETAGQIVADWYQQTQQAAPRLAQTAAQRARATPQGNRPRTTGMAADDQSTPVVRAAPDEA